eukprot:11989745-Ditylum_brightwellii.AAC.1
MLHSVAPSKRATSAETRIWTLFEQACLGWNFQLSSSHIHQPCWLHRYDGCSKKKTEDKYVRKYINRGGEAGIECSFGVWGGVNTFLKRHAIPNLEVESVTFKRKEGIAICCVRNVRILVSQAIIANFCLIDCSETQQAKLLIPLSSAPCVIAPDPKNKKTDIRLTDFDSAFFPHLRAVSVNTVICLSISQSASVDYSLDPRLSLVRSLLELEKEFLAVPTFETRVHIEDETQLVRLVDWEKMNERSDEKSNDHRPLLQSEFAFVVSRSNAIQIIDPHLSRMPSFNTSQSEVRDAHWLLLSAFSQRLGCFTDDVRKFLWDFVTEVVNNLLAALNSVILGISDELSGL